MSGSQLDRVAELRAELRCDQGAQQKRVLSSGCRALDRLLPAGGFRCGSLVEWVGPALRRRQQKKQAPHPSLASAGQGGASWLALRCALHLSQHHPVSTQRGGKGGDVKERRAATSSADHQLGKTELGKTELGRAELGRGRARQNYIGRSGSQGKEKNFAPSIVLVDREQTLYPPALAAAGFDLGELLVVRPESQADENWALQQAFACPGLGAVVGWPAASDDVTFRKWQLAIESSSVIGMLVRHFPSAAQRSWADVRLRVSTLPASPTAGGEPGQAGSWKLRIEVLNCRGTFASGHTDLQFDELTGVLHAAIPGPLASSLGSPATGEQSA